MKKKLKNKFEYKLFNQLKKSKVSFSYESERLPYILKRYYLPDFVVATPSGTVYIEAKGYLRPEHRSKLAAVKQQHPDIDLRIVFYSHSLKNEKWAEKHGIPWAVSEIPKEWLK